MFISEVITISGAMASQSNAKKPSTAVSFLTGCVAGAAECIATWPMEYMKTQLQLHNQKGTGASKPPFTGVLSGMAYTVRTTGFLSLYNGLSVTLV